MIARLRALLLGDMSSFERPGRHDTDELVLAAAALLVEAAVLDGDFDADERHTIARLLGERFGVEPKETARIIEEAAEAARQTSQLYAFTRVIKDRFDAEERVRMIEMLWDVVYADGKVHDYEASLVRRVAGLIYVPDRDSGAARKRALQRAGMADDRPAPD
jgi:uncharacterized tellurite resistance protein B-like protein